MAEIARTTIRGYTAVIEPNEDREGVNCYISHGRFSGTLAWAEGEGYLYCDSQEEIIPDDVVFSIRKFAEKHGY